jgi:hypothetical protein
MTTRTKNFGSPDEVRQMPNDHGRGELVHLGDMTVGRGELAPGWRWSNDIRPIAGTTSCEFEHRGVALEGRLHVELDDGEAFDVKAGDAYLIPPGHDAWVVGDEPYRSIDWSLRLDEFAKPKS